MIGLSGLGFRRKPRQFSYKPVFWDEAKEARAARDEAAKMNDPNYQADHSYKPGSIIRAQRLRRLQSSARQNKRSGSTLIRIAIFLGLIVGALYFLTDFFTKFTN